MSIITPKVYKLIAEDLANAYVRVRNSIFQDGVSLSSSSFGDLTDAQTQIVSVSDNDYNGCGAPGAGESADPTNANFSVWQATTKYTAPTGSISADLGKSVESTLKTLREAQAKKKAAGMFSSILNDLNKHVVSRTYNVTTLASYYDTYAFTSGNEDLSLFWNGGSTPPLGDSSYFSADFIELTNQITGTTIDSDYEAS